MSLTIASFVIAALSLMLAAIVLIIGQPSDTNKGTRRVIGVSFLLGAILFGFIGLFSLVGSNVPIDSNTPELIVSNTAASESNSTFGAQEEISALQTQVALQETVIAQQQDISANRSESPIVPSQDSIPGCAFLLAAQLDQLKLASSVSEAIRQAEEYAGNLQNDYQSDEMIPAGVVIATDLQNADISKFPVSPIKNQGGWGLFLTTDEFLAPNDGTYWCIR